MKEEPISLKPSELIQIQEIINHFKNEGVHWGRKDHFDKRMENIEKWLDDSLKWIEK